MNAVFINRTSVLRDSHIDPDSPPESWQLAPATIEAMRLLATDDRLLFVFDTYCQPSAPDSEEEEPENHRLHTIVRQVEAGGGRIDGLVTCQHAQTDTCACWGDTPGVLWVVASQLGLGLDQCFLIGDCERDVDTAASAGARPILILGGRTVSEVQRERPPHKDHPIATNLTASVDYVNIEEESYDTLGHPRAIACPVPPTEELYANPESLPVLDVTSRIAQNRQADIHRSRVQLRDLGRWMSLFIAGALGLSLGIAYLLTHLYRSQPFPGFVYYVTLQFIPRAVRGTLFVILGVLMLAFTARSFYRSAAVFRRRRS